MKKLHSLVFYALVTPAITLGASSVLAQQSTGQHMMDREQQSTQRDQGATPSGTGTMMQGDQDTRRDGSHMDNRGYMSAAPADGMRANHLIGATVRTSGDEDVGSVSDLIIGDNGQVVAIVVGVGGFLGLGEKDVAIGWGDVTRSGSSDELELRIDVTREDLESAPEFEERN
jgi:sporulation protein YlmC with PRC-barrel domain